MRITLDDFFRGEVAAEIVDVALALGTSPGATLPPDWPLQSSLDDLRYRQNARRAMESEVKRVLRVLELDGDVVVTDEQTASVRVATITIDLEP